MGGSIQITKGLTMKRCCGACKWFDDKKPRVASSQGVCRYPLPTWLEMALFWTVSGWNERRYIEPATQGCPCYEEKEER